MDGSTADDWRRRLETIFEAILIERPEYAQLRFIGFADGGREIVRVDRIDGGIRSTPQDRLQRKGDRPYFLEALGTPKGAIYFSPVTLNEDFGAARADEPTVRALAPVFDPNGAIYGFISINALADRMFATAFKDVTAQGDVYVLTESGDYLQKPEDGEATFHYRGALAADAPAAVRLLRRTFRDDGATFVDLDGVESAVQFAEFAFDDWSPARTLRIALVAPKARFLAGADRMRAATLWTAIAISCAAAAFAAILGGRVTAPFSRIVKQIKAFGEDGARTGLPIDRADEIGELARAFDEMARKVDVSAALARDTLDRMRLLRDHAQDTLILIDEYGMILDFNAAAVRMFGYEKDEAIGQSVSMLIPAPERRNHEDSLARYREGGESGIAGVDRVVTAMRKDGSTLPVELRVSEFEIAGRRVFNGALRDVSERQLMEDRVARYTRELELSEERFALAMLSAKEGLWDWDLATGHVYYSPRWCQILGFAQSEVPPHVDSWGPLVHPDDVGDLSNLVSKFVKGDDDIVDSEFRMRRKDGSWVYVHAHAFRILAEDGRVARVVGTTVDISRRKAAEMELATRNGSLDLLGRVAALANDAASSDQALTLVVDLVCDFLAWPVGHAFRRDETTGLLTPTTVWRFDDPDRYETFRRATDGRTVDPNVGLLGDAFRERRPMFAPDYGRNRAFMRSVAADAVGLVSGLAFPVVAGDVPVAVLEFFTDSDEAPAPQVIEALSQVGPHIGRVFEREQAARRVLAAKDEAERTNRSKSEFLANVSHELRTPLNAVVGFAEILADAADDEVAPAQRRHAVDILESGQHLMELINDLLDTAKIEAGRFEIARAEFPLAKDLESVVKLLAGQLKAKRLRLDLKLDGVDPATLLDADRRGFRQILLNLLSNAMKFSLEDGRIEVRIEAHGRDLRLVVADQGIGIPTEQLERVFERFEQVRNPNSPAVGGTGIGLPLSRMLAEMHGGTLHLESVYGQGTRAVLALPACLREGTETDASLVEAQVERPNAIVFRQPPRILVAEDHPVSQTLMRAILAHFGCAADIAADGEEALGAARRNRYDLIFMDLQMPRLDGAAAARALRQLRGGSARTPIVALTANAMREHRDQTIEAGMNDHLGKPATRADVARMLERWLGDLVVTTPATAEGAAPEAPSEAPQGCEDVADEDLVDEEMTMELCRMTGVDVIARLTEGLIEDRAIHVGIMRQALSAGDWPTVATSAHRLKGALAALGGVRAPAIAERLQAAAESGGDDVDALLPRFEAVSDATTRQLKAILTRLRENAAAAG
ncbi:MAG: PAS domain S-box protein [Alphaproteobacteria bacterium]